jgi:hypothetical protein
MTNVLLGILGFYVCASLVKADREAVAHAVWTSAYAAMFAILSFGYDRFLYAGTMEQFKKGYKFPVVDFFATEVFYTLLVMSVFVIPPLYYAMSQWPAGPRMTDDRKTRMIRDAVKPYLRLSGLVVTGFLILYASGYLPRRWHIDRVVGFAIGQAVFGTAIFLPLFFIPVKKNPEAKTRKAD